MAKKVKGQTQDDLDDVATPAAPPAPAGGPSIIGSIIAAAQAAAAKQKAQQTTTGGNPLYDPNAPPVDYSSYGTSGPSSHDYAADRAERAREFDVTTARDIAKQGGTEVDALQARLAALSGPKDAYADYFFSHGLMPPQGYKPAPVPLTDAQIAAYGKQGVTPQQLQTMLGGNGQPGAAAGMLGNMGSSLQTAPGMPQAQAIQSTGPPQTVAPPQSVGPPSNPPIRPGGGDPRGMSYNVATPQPQGVTPGGVPSMAAGGQVPGEPGTPSLAVVHGGETVTPAGQPPAPPQGGPPQGGALMSNPGLHPAIAQLVDAVSQLLSNPDFRPFVEAAQDSSRATAGGVPSMASGGTIPSSAPNPTTSGASGTGVMAGSAPSPPTSQSAPTTPAWNANASGFNPGSVNPPTAQSQVTSRPPTTVNPTSGAPMGGAQGVISNAGEAPPDVNPAMPTGNMDPYTRALYDIHGRLHPYSAQQQLQMGTQGMDAVTSYVGRVQGGDVKAYQNLADRLKPQAGAPSASAGTASEGFSFG